MRSTSSFHRARRRSDRDLLVLARGVVLRRHVQDAVGVDIKRHFDLRNATRRRRNPGQVELAQSAVLRRHRTLPLQHVHFNRSLTVGRGRKRFRLLSRNRSVARNHRRSHAAQRLDRQSQRSHVQQQQVFHFALQHAALDGRADGHHFIRIHALVAFLAEQILYQLLNARHARLAADQHHFVDLAGIDARIFHALLARTHRALHDVFDHRFQLGPGQLLDQVLGAGGIRRDERQIDLGLHRGREFDLGPLRRVTQTLQRHLVALAAQVEAFIFLELVDQPVHDALVDVVAAQVRVAVGGLHFDHAFADFKNRNIERAAAEVVDRDGLVLLLVEPVGQRRRRRLVDDALHFEAGDLARRLWWPAAARR